MNKSATVGDSDTGRKQLDNRSLIFIFLFLFFLFLFLFTGCIHVELMTCCHDFRTQNRVLFQNKFNFYISVSVDNFIN